MNEAIKLAIAALEKLWLLGDEAAAICNPALAALRAQLTGWKLIPIKPSDACLHSMAVRYDHGLGMDGYYDNSIFDKSPTPNKHAQRLESTKRIMNQLYEEAIGEGFYRLPDTGQERAQPDHSELMRECLAFMQNKCDVKRGCIADYIALEEKLANALNREKCYYETPTGSVCNKCGKIH